MDTSPFRQELEAAVNARHSRMNPFTEKWVKGELTRPQLGAWASQHYQYVSQFPRWCATVYGDCADADARDFLLENIVEEESGTKHVDLLIRFAEACGVSRAEVERTRQLPTTRGLTAWCFEMSRAPFHVAAAGLLVGLESQVPGIYRRNLPPLTTHYGFSDHEVSSSRSTSRRTRSTASAATRSSSSTARRRPGAPKPSRPCARRPRCAGST